MFKWIMAFVITSIILVHLSGVKPPVAPDRPVTPAAAPAVVTAPTSSPTASVRYITFFKFNSATVGKLPKSSIEAYCSSHKCNTITVVGHTDKHGSRAFNKALGEERAKAVAKLLKLKGVKIIVKSAGEDTPMSKQNAPNRRVTITIN